MLNRPTGIWVARAYSRAQIDGRGAAKHGWALSPTGKYHTAEVPRNPCGWAGSSAGEYDAAKVTVHCLAEYTGGKCQGKNYGERSHDTPLTELYR